MPKARRSRPTCEKAKVSVLPITPSPHVSKSLKRKQKRDSLMQRLEAENAKTLPKVKGGSRDTSLFSSMAVDLLASVPKLDFAFDVKGQEASSSAHQNHATPSAVSNKPAIRKSNRKSLSCAISSSLFCYALMPWSGNPRFKILLQYWLIQLLKLIRLRQSKIT